MSIFKQFCSDIVPYTATLTSQDRALIDPLHSLKKKKINPTHF